MCSENQNHRLVYSDDMGGRVRLDHAKTGNSSPKKKAVSVPSDGVVRVSRQTKGRKGKGVTVITGIPEPPDALEKLARELKQKCGTGGTLKNGTIEIQGDHRDMLLDLLKERGYTVKKSGG